MQVNYVRNAKWILTRNLWKLEKVKFCGRGLEVQAGKLCWIQKFIGDKCNCSWVFNLNKQWYHCRDLAEKGSWLQLNLVWTFFLVFKYCLNYPFFKNCMLYCLSTNHKRHILEQHTARLLECAWLFWVVSYSLELQTLNCAVDSFFEYS